jgi:teichuronic acid biosynthesis glycosyltransferase TuaG
VPSPTVSIVMPCLNGMSYLSQAMASVRAQSFGDWELIVVDDGSTDGSLAEVSAASQHDARVIALRTRGRTGAAHARNVGMARATGRYMAFLDCDDWWRPDKLERQLAALQTDRAAFCCAPYLVCNETGTPMRQQVVTAPLTADRYLKKQWVIGCLTVVVDRERLGDFAFIEGLPMAEDFLLWYELLLRAERMGLHAVCTDESLAFYRVHPGGKSSSKLRHARAHWQIFTRELGLPWLSAVRCFACYAFNGLRDRTISRLATRKLR